MLVFVLDLNFKDAQKLWKKLKFLSDIPQTLNLAKKSIVSKMVHYLFYMFFFISFIY